MIRNHIGIRTHTHKTERLYDNNTMYIYNSFPSNQMDCNCVRVLDAHVLYRISCDWYSIQWRHTTVISHGTNDHESWVAFQWSDIHSEFIHCQISHICTIFIKFSSLSTWVQFQLFSILFFGSYIFFLLFLFSKISNIKRHYSKFYFCEKFWHFLKLFLFIQFH